MKLTRGLRRREVLGASAAVATATLPSLLLSAGCSDEAGKADRLGDVAKGVANGVAPGTSNGATTPPQSPNDNVPWQGGWVGANLARGHALRDALSRDASGELRLPDAAGMASERYDVVIVGGGVAGLAAARALRRAGVDDFVVLDLEDEAGGNARSHRIDGIACPLGAHYLPVPGDELPALRECLAEFGLMRHEHGRWRADERHLCHAPQERLWFEGAWVDGLLPPAAPGSRRAQQYETFARAVDDGARQLSFVMPMAAQRWGAGHAALDAISFARWLRDRGLDDGALLGYLDYACRDDFGAGIGTVSAWAGLHYFASRHGFRSPDENGLPAARSSSNTAADEEAGVFTWPEGNGWLTRALAAPLGERVRTGQAVMQVRGQGSASGRGTVDVVALDTARQRWTRYQARHVIAAVPMHVAARVIRDESLAPRCQAARGVLAHAPWLVANLHIGSPLDDREGAPPSWDSVLHSAAGDSDALGYVDASHQSLSPIRAATVLTAYWALGRDGGDGMRAQRRELQDGSWAMWSRRVVDDLARAHPDLPERVTRADLMRWGHAMAIPRPGTRTWLQAQGLHRSAPGQRIHLAHSDLAGYSTFEEAFSFGHEAGRHVAAAIRD